MQVEAETESHDGLSLDQVKADVPSVPIEAPRTRKVTVQLSEPLFERLEAATDRPGVGKSMVMEAALERFLDPAPPIEGLLHEALNRIATQIERLESEVRVIGETVALHARYHLTVTPPMPQPQQREACVLGQERFKTLAEQVDARVRLGRPLMRETIANLHAANLNSPVLESGGSFGSARIDQETLYATNPDAKSDTTAAVQEGGSNSNFQHLPNAFC
jgi:hypothetical protein